MTEELQVPQNLCIYVHLALEVEQELKTNITDEALSSRLTYLKERIALLANIHKSNGDLPSDWEYHPDTASICVPRQVPANKQKPKEKPPRNPHIDSAPLVGMAKSYWRNFKKLDRSRKTTTLIGLPFPTDEEIKTRLEVDNEFVTFIGDFAVGVFNDSCQMYFNKNNNKNISGAKIMECKYLKVRPCYLFYMTIEAVEQGKLGVYEITLRCNLDDGAIVLDTFFLTDREPSGRREGAIISLESIYETFKDDSTDHKVYYEITGMARRMTEGGYDYYNPHGWERLVTW